MNASTRPPRIGIFGHYGHENLGDEAITAAVIQNIRRRRRDAVIHLFSMNPRDSAARYGLPVYPIRRRSNESWLPQPAQPEAPETYIAHRGGRSLRSFLRRWSLVSLPVRLLRVTARGLRGLIREALFLRRTYSRLRQIDLLLIAGSNQLLDNFGGPWGYPYTLLKWSALAKLAGIKVAYASVGAGPLDAWLSKRLVRAALRFADAVSFRDEGSARMIRSLGYAGPGIVCPDLAHSLYFDGPVANSMPGLRAPLRPLVAVNPMPMYDERYWCAPDASRYNSYISRFAAFCDSLAHDRYSLVFFGTQTSDYNVITDVMHRMRSLNGRFQPDVRVERLHSVDELIRFLTTAHIVVATRFHGTLLALFARTPVLAICYYRKARELMRDMGQEDYAVDLDHFTVSDALLRFRSLEANRRDQVAQIERRNQEYRHILDCQYDAVLALVTSP